MQLVSGVALKPSTSDSTARTPELCTPQPLLCRNQKLKLSFLVVARGSRWGEESGKLLNGQRVSDLQDESWWDTGRPWQKQGQLGDPGPGRL